MTNNSISLFVNNFDINLQIIDYETETMIDMYITNRDYTEFSYYERFLRESVQENVQNQNNAFFDSLYYSIKKNNIIMDIVFQQHSRITFDYKINGFIKTSTSNYLITQITDTLLMCTKQPISTRIITKKCDDKELTISCIKTNFNEDFDTRYTYFKLEFVHDNNKYTQIMCNLNIYNPEQYDFMVKMFSNEKFNEDVSFTFAKIDDIPYYKYKQYMHIYLTHHTKFSSDNVYFLISPNNYKLYVPNSLCVKYYKVEQYLEYKTQMIECLKTNGLSILNDFPNLIGFTNDLEPIMKQENSNFIDFRKIAYLNPEFIKLITSKSESINYIHITGKQVFHGCHDLNNKLLKSTIGHFNAIQIIYIYFDDDDYFIDNHDYWLFGVNSPYKCVLVNYTKHTINLSSSLVSRIFTINCKNLNNQDSIIVKSKYYPLTILDGISNIINNFNINNK